MNECVPVCAHIETIAVQLQTSAENVHVCNASLTDLPHFLMAQVFELLEQRQEVKTKASSSKMGRRPAAL